MSSNDSKIYTLVKLGGSLITDKSRPYTVRYEILKRLAKEIKEAQCPNLIVGHGSGSFGHQSAHKYQTQKGIINEKSCEGIAVVHNDAARLNSIVIDCFIKEGINAISVQPSSSAICKNSRIIQWNCEPIRRMLQNNLVPVPYGDVGFDTEKGCCIISTEEVLSFLAKQFLPSKVIIVGKVDGVLATEPDSGSKATLIPKITTKNLCEIKKHLAGSDGLDVTGGMASKVESMIELAEAGIKSEIINGEKPGYLRRVLEGKEGLGTIIEK